MLLLFTVLYIAAPRRCGEGSEVAQTLEYLRFDNESNQIRDLQCANSTSTSVDSQSVTASNGSSGKGTTCKKQGKIDYHTWHRRLRILK